MVFGVFCRVVGLSYTAASPFEPLGPCAPFGTNITTRKLVASHVAISGRPASRSLVKRTQPLMTWATINLLDTRAIFGMIMGSEGEIVLWPLQNPDVGSMSFWLTKNIHNELRRWGSLAPRPDPGSGLGRGPRFSAAQLPAYFGWGPRPSVKGSDVWARM